MLPSMMNQPFTRRRYARVLDHGTLVIDLDSTPAVQTFYGSIQPGTGSVDFTNRNGAEVVYTILARPNADVQANDLIELYGDEYFINGSPERWGTGILDHVLIRLSRWEG